MVGPSNTTGATMTFEISSPHYRPARSASLIGVLDRMPGAVLVGVALLLGLTFGKAIAVWQTGMFFGPDDAMRASEVRDFLAGQGWYDLVPKRMSPHHPFVMHWSRLADLPLAAMMTALRTVTDFDTAERIARLLQPTGLFLLLLITLVALARDLCGRGGSLAVALLAAGSLDIVADFMPGRIHHHALQLLLLAAMTKLVCDGLDPKRSGRMILAGAVAALSLAINLQNMPFVLAGAALIGLVWAGQGAPMSRSIERFGIGLASGATIVFLAQVPPDRYLVGTCDAFGAPHLLATSIGSLCFVGLGRATHRLTGAGLRLAALAAAGVVTLVVLKLTFPACLGDPYGAVDPFVRQNWMAEVGEALPLPVMLVGDPLGTIPIVISLVLGIAGILVACFRETGLARHRWLVLAGLALTAILGTFWQIRVAASAEIFSALGGAWLLCRLFGSGGERPYQTLLAFSTGLMLTTAGWTAALATVEPARLPRTSDPRWLEPIDIDRCFDPSSFAGLNSLPPGLVLSTVDPGAHILVHTAHSVVAGPYHRNTDGIRLSLQVFGVSVEDARVMLDTAEVGIVALCTASVETHDIVRASPDGFAAQILSGRVPSWLTAIDAPGPYRIFVLRRQ